MRRSLLTLALLLLRSAQASAEWQIRPFLGVTFGGSTTLVDLEHAAGQANLAIGISGVLLGEVIGVEANVAHAPGFFQSGDQHLVMRSSTTTLTGNVVIALPRNLTEYTLRPYIVAGAGLMYAHIDDTLGVLRTATRLPVTDVGGGVTGFLTNRIGLNWEVRYFRSIGGGTEGRGVSFGAEQLSFWCAHMAIAIRA